MIWGWPCPPATPVLELPTQNAMDHLELTSGVHRCIAVVSAYYVRTTGRLQQDIFAVRELADLARLSRHGPPAFPVVWLT